MTKIYRQLKEAIDASGKSRYRICKDTGISEATMSRFMSGHRGLSVARIEQLSEYLDLEIKITKRGDG